MIAMRNSPADRAVLDVDCSVLPTSGFLVMLWPEWPMVASRIVGLQLVHCRRTKIPRLSQNMNLLGSKSYLKPGDDVSVVDHSTWRRKNHSSPLSQS